MQRRRLSVFCVIVLVMQLLGCATVEENIEKETTGTDVAETDWEIDEEGHFKDNDLLYENDDDTSVVTMYLTVTKGNVSENTNHTWEEVNSYSVYDYEEMGVERYGVNGLLQVGDENGPIEGELGYNQYVPNATVTIRGQTSSRQPQKNYKIKLTDKAGTWNDQQTINLNKHAGDGIRFRNKLMYDLLEEIPGMMALQTQFVHLYVKDETEGTSAEFKDYGVYTQVEQPNKSFLARHGLDKNGHLYKINMFEFYRYEDVIMLKSDANYDQKAFEYRIEIKGSDNHSKLIEMLEDLNDYVIPTETILDEWFDVENLASWMAFHILTGNVDTQSRNTLLYSPLNGKKWYLISWDNDGALRRTEDNVHFERSENGWECGISNYWGNVLFQRALKNEEFRLALDNKITEMRKFLSEEKMTELVTKYKDVVLPYVYGECDILHAPLTKDEYDYVCSQIPKEIEQNYQLYKESLTKPMPFFIGVPQVVGDEVEFVWDSAYDFDNENVFYTFELADNFAFDNVIARESDIFIPGFTYKGVLEPGQYFVRVKATNESGKDQYAFDYYVGENSEKKYGVLSFYVFADGSIGVEEHEE